MNHTGGLPQEAIDAALSNDKIRKRAERIMNMMFDNVEQTFRFGTEAEKATLTKVAMPAILRSLQTAEQDEGAAQMRRAYGDMRQAFGEIVGAAAALHAAE